MKWVKQAWPPTFPPEYRGWLEGKLTNKGKVCLAQCSADMSDTVGWRGVTPQTIIAKSRHFMLGKKWGPPLQLLLVASVLFG